MRLDMNGKIHRKPERLKTDLKKRGFSVKSVRMRTRAGPNCMTLSMKITAVRRAAYGTRATAAG